MPLLLPNPLIHIISIIRPSLLRPHLRVPSIASVDFAALRKVGFNTVVVDKDNCLTAPHHDELYEPIRGAWARLLSAFEPGRVLVVSNSAGSQKDPGGISAEHLSLHLHAPVLLHRAPKPACAQDIIAYFQSRLLPPTTLRAQIRHGAATAREAVQGDEEEVVRRWRVDVESGPLLGIYARESPTEGRRSIPESAGRQDTGQGLERRMNVRQALETHPREEAEQTDDPIVPITRSGQEREEQTKSGLRMIVIGDRLFTDTILAHRLSLYLPPPANAKEVTVLSIQTIHLPDPSDSRLLRWVEDRLSHGKLAAGPVDWGRYVFSSPADARGNKSGDSQSAQNMSRWWDVRGRMERIPRLHWRDRTTWRPAPLVLAVAREMGAVLQSAARAVGSATRWAWTRIQSRPRLDGEDTKKLV